MPLRPLIESDLSTTLEWRNAPAVRENMYKKHEISEVEHRNWFVRQQDDEHSRWYIYESEMNKPEGVVYFTKYQPQQQNSFWGFYANPNAKAGTGSYMLFEALDHAFFKLGLHKLNGEALAKNAKSIGIHKKMGFHVEGIFRDSYFDGGVFFDVVRLGILKSEWISKRSEIIGRIERLGQMGSAKHV